MYQPSATHRIAQVLVSVMFYGGILCVILIPWLGGPLWDYYEYGQNERQIFTAVLFSSGLCCLYILYTLKPMYRSLLGGNPFTRDNISCFRKMAIACALISLIYLIKCFLMFSVATAVFVLMFAIGTLFCLTLKDIFKQALFYKEEHDWTV